MPKFVYIRSQFGVFPQVLRDDSVFGVTGDKQMNIVQSHDISDIEASASLNVLMNVYPLEVKNETE